jgi:uncharacterized protein involved in exopolysaccharide biosynthesis
MGAISLLLAPTYTASTTFVPASGGSPPTLPAGLAGLATQFGINIASGSSLSPDFFAEVLTSRELLRATLLSSFDDPRRAGSSRALLDILDVRHHAGEDRLSEGIRQLEKDVSQRVDRRTGIVTLTVKGRPPALVAAVANRMVELLNTFNLEKLQSQSRERRRFAEERKNQAEQELRAAEAQHLRFLQSNRRYNDSPLLSFEENRLARQVQLRQEIFQTLTREYEEARIAEVRDTPLLTTIDAAVPPDRRTFPQPKLLVFLVMLASGLTTVAFVYLREHRRASELSDAPEYRAFLEAWKSAKSEIGAILRRRR